MKHNFMFYWITAFLALSQALAQQPNSVPKLINYQGKLTNAEGLALQNGNYEVRFTLWDVASGGNLVWGENRSITLIGGVFNVALGGAGATGVPGAPVLDISYAFGSAQRYLQTTIVSGPTITQEQTLAPRQQMVSVPFAVEAQNAFQAQQSVNSDNLAGQPPSFWLPPGMISAYGGSSDSVGWLICDGRAVSRTQYAQLFEAIGETFGAGDGATTFNLPNGRGLVLRGSGSQMVNGRPKAGPNLGAIQEDTLQGHGHNLRKTAGNGDSSANAISTNVDRLLFTSNTANVSNVRGTDPSGRAMIQVANVGVYAGVDGLNNWCILEGEGRLFQIYRLTTVHPELEMKLGCPHLE
jgi:microcystin-dependent protein